MHSVDVTIRDADDETVLNQSYEIEQAGSGSTPGGTVINETGFTQATPDEQFVAVALLNRDQRYEHRYQATCITEDTDDVFIIEIESGRETSLGFDQSLCD